MNSIKWDCYIGIEISDETRQDDWLFHFGSTIRLLSIQTSSSLAVCAKKQFYLQNERKTNSFWIAIDFDNVKNRTALEFMEIGRRIRQCSFQPLF
jgi:hypothetical protein